MRPDALYARSLNSIRSLTFLRLPCGPGVKNLPAHAGHTAPSPGRSHVPASSEAHAPQRVSPGARAGARPRQKPPEKATHRHEGQPRAPQPESPLQRGRPGAAKVNSSILKTLKAFHFSYLKCIIPVPY